MKRLSIKLKITLWFSVILIVITLFASAVILYVSNNVYQKTVKDTLISTIDNNLDEIEFYANMKNRNDVDQYIAYKDGYLEIDDDYLNNTNGVSSALYDESNLLYGENPLSKYTKDIPFSNEKITTITVGHLKYYIFDRELKGNGLDGLWLRGIVSSAQGREQTSSVLKLIMYFIPTFVLFSILVGYYLAKRLFSPVEKISETAKQISQENDLKKRIALKDGNDELHQLANTFNEMLARLDNAFEVEKQFTSNASHELKTPVSVVLAQCELTLSEPASTEDYEEALITIQRQGNKMNKIISNMLTCTRLEANSEIYKKEQMNLSELVEHVCLDMKYIMNKNIELCYDIEENIFIDGNKDLLTQLITNLISNAYSYGRENGHIFIELKTENDRIKLSVTDDGIGISEENKEKIFNRFYQIDDSHSGNGAGLGLSIVSEIAKFHNAIISVESELSKGSTFTFELKK